MQRIVLGSIHIPPLNWGLGICDPWNRKNRETRIAFFLKLYKVLG